MDRFSLTRTDTPSPNVDWIADSFLESNAQRTIPIEIDEPWPSVTEFAESGKLVLGLFPAFLNIDMRFHRAIREAGALVCTFPVEQLKIASNLVPLLNIGSVVTLARDLPRVRSEVEVSAPNTSLNYLAILAPGETPAQDSETSMCYEIHFAPGIPAFIECPSHREAVHRFHPSARFEWRFDAGQAYAHDPRQRFAEASFPYHTYNSDECSCGASVSITVN